VNDPFTAITCLKWFGVALIRVGGRRIPSPYRYDKEGHLRVVTETTDFAGLAAAALNQIRQYGRGSIAVVVRLLGWWRGWGNNCNGRRTARPCSSMPEPRARAGWRRPKMSATNAILRPALPLRKAL